MLISLVPSSVVKLLTTCDKSNLPIKAEHTIEVLDFWHRNLCEDDRMITLHVERCTVAIQPFKTFMACQSQTNNNHLLNTSQLPAGGEPNRGRVLPN